MGIFKKPPTKPISGSWKEVRKKDVVFLLCFFIFFKLIILFKGVDTTINIGPRGVILDFPKKTPRSEFLHGDEPSPVLGGGGRGGKNKTKKKKKVKNPFLGAV